jgi:uncharacterized protein (TIGR00369 family)
MFQPKLSADELNALLLRAFPGADPQRMSRVTEVGAGRVRMRMPGDQAMLRPGGVMAGPVLMNLADAAAYALVLAHIGERLMAVTSTLTIHFLNGARPGDLHAEASLLRLGARSAVCDVRLWTDDPETLAAHATVAYAIPA